MTTAKKCTAVYPLFGLVRRQRYLTSTKLIDARSMSSSAVTTFGSSNDNGVIV